MSLTDEQVDSLIQNKKFMNKLYDANEDSMDRLSRNFWVGAIVLFLVALLLHVLLN